MFNLFHKNIDQKQRVERYGCWLMLALAALYAFVCTPVYYVANSNVLLQDSVFTFAWDFVNDTVQYLYYWVAFSFVIFFAAKYAFRSIGKLLAVFAGCSVSRYFFGLIIVFMIDKDWDLFGYEMKQVLEVVLGDLLMMGIAVLLVYLIISKKTQTKALSESFQSASVLQIRYPLMGGMLAVAFIPALMRIASRIWFDLFLGAPQGNSDLVSMIVYYVGDVLCAVIGYLVIFLIVSQLTIKAEQTKSKE